jgi:hypothetical protein
MHYLVLLVSLGGTNSEKLAPSLNYPYVNKAASRNVEVRHITAYILNCPRFGRRE